jgi:hypothetical protein
VTTALGIFDCFSRADDVDDDDDEEAAAEAVVTEGWPSAGSAFARVASSVSRPLA